MNTDTQTQQLNRLLKSPAVQRVLAAEEERDAARRKAEIKRLEAALADAEQRHAVETAAVNAEITTKNVEHDERYAAFAEVQSRLSSLMRQRMALSHSFDVARSEIESRIRALNAGQEVPSGQSPGH